MRIITPSIEFLSSGLGSSKWRRRTLSRCREVIFDEVAPPPGPLADWVKQKEVRDLMILSEPIARARVTHVLVRGYAPDLTDVEIEKIAKDPFLVAAAIAAPDRIVVTREVSKPKRQRANRKVPDICNAFGVGVITDFQLYRILKFSIP